MEKDWDQQCSLPIVAAENHCLLFRDTGAHTAAYPFIEEGDEAISFRFPRCHVLNHTCISKKQKQDPGQRLHHHPSLLKNDNLSHTPTPYLHVSPLLRSTAYCTSSTVKAKGFFSTQNFTNALAGSSKIKLKWCKTCKSRASLMYFTTVGPRFKMLLQTVKDTKPRSKQLLQRITLQHVANISSRALFNHAIFKCAIHLPTHFYLLIQSIK